MTAVASILCTGDKTLFYHVQELHRQFAPIREQSVIRAVLGSPGHQLKTRHARGRSGKSNRALPAGESCLEKDGDRSHCHPAHPQRLPCMWSSLAHGGALRSRHRHRASTRTSHSAQQTFQCGTVVPPGCVSLLSSRADGRGAAVIGALCLQYFVITAAALRGPNSD